MPDNTRTLGYDVRDRLAQTDSYTLTPGTNRLASITGALGTRSIQYDARGNTQSESRNYTTTCNNP